jgi:hypothetical protein
MKRQILQVTYAYPDNRVNAPFAIAEKEFVLDLDAGDTFEGYGQHDYVHVAGHDILTFVERRREGFPTLKGGVVTVDPSKCLWREVREIEREETAADRPKVTSGR